MDIQSVLPSIVAGLTGFFSGFGLAILKGVSKVVEDVWSDYRESQRKKRLKKETYVNQLLFDIPRAKAQNFEVTTCKASEQAQRVAQIAIYDKKMSQRVDAYLNLIRHHAKAFQQMQRSTVVTIVDESGEVVEKGVDYLEELNTKLYNEYQEIIDLLNMWKR